MSIIEFAERKLGPPRSPESLGAEHAALDVRIGLSFDHTNIESREKEFFLVAWHMRLAYVVPENREFIHSGYSSEPILAEAAARLLNREVYSVYPIRPFIASKGPEILYAAYRANLLARDERAETVARLLMTIAHDSVIMKENPPFVAAAVFHWPIHLLDFLRHLFHEKYHDVVLDTKPVMAGTNSKTLREAFENAYISFSHFSSAGDVEATKRGKIHKLLLRGLALHCTHTQNSIDMAIPVFFGDPKNDQISEENTSVLQVRIMNRKTRGIPWVDPDVVLIPKEGTPVLSLFLELGTEECGVEMVSEDSSAGSWDQPNEHHYLVASYGCSSRTFSAIPRVCDYTYLQMLASSQITSDLNRPTLMESVKMVYCLLFYLFASKGELQPWDWAD